MPDVLFLGSDFWKVNPPVKLTDEGIPWKIKEEIAQAYLLIKRSTEELLLLEADMKATLHYWLNRSITISKRLDELTSISEDPCVRGGRSLLERLKLEAEFQQQRGITMFSPFLQVPTSMFSTSQILEENFDSDDSESEPESESEFSELEF